MRLGLPGTRGRGASSSCASTTSRSTTARLADETAPVPGFRTRAVAPGGRRHALGHRHEQAGLSHRSTACGAGPRPPRGLRRVAATRCRSASRIRLRCCMPPRSWDCRRSIACMWATRSATCSPRAPPACRCWWRCYGYLGPKDDPAALGTGRAHRLARGTARLAATVMNGWPPAATPWRAASSLITGATGGIGRALAIDCVRAGADVVLVARNVQQTPGPAMPSSSCCAPARR